MTRKTSLISLLLLVPAPTIGATFAMILSPNSPLGTAVFALAKAWVLLLPVVWLVLVEKQRISMPKLTTQGLAWGAITGLTIGIVIILAYYTIGRHLIDPSAFKSMITKVGLANSYIYLAGAVYWILINSLLEEYVWRWFVVRQCQAIVSSRPAIAIAALAFTAHHIIALQVYFSWPIVIPASLGVFIGASVWSHLYIKYRSIWPCYLSHAIVDAAIFLIGYLLIFRSN